MTMIPKAEDIIKNFNSLKSVLVEIMSGNKPHYKENIICIIALYDLVTQT